MVSHLINAVKTCDIKLTAIIGPAQIQITFIV